MRQRGLRPKVEPSANVASVRLSATTQDNSAPSQDIGIDPDPFTLIGAIIAAVAGVAQIVSVAHELWPKKPATKNEAAKGFVHHLEDQLHETIRDIERVERFLRNVNTIDGQEVLTAPNEFGHAIAFPGPQFSEYERMVEKMTWCVAGLNKMTLGVIRYDPEFAALLGADILDSLGDIRDRINAMRTGTNEEALHQALFILREIERLLQRLQQQN